MKKGAPEKKLPCKTCHLKTQIGRDNWHTYERGQSRYHKGIIVHEPKLFTYDLIKKKKAIALHTAWECLCSKVVRVKVIWEVEIVAFSVFLWKKKNFNLVFISSCRPRFVFPWRWCVNFLRILDLEGYFKFLQPKNMKTFDLFKAGQTKNTLLMGISENKKKTCSP